MPSGESRSRCARFPGAGRGRKGACPEDGAEGLVRDQEYYCFLAYSFCSELALGVATAAAAQQKLELDARIVGLQERLQTEVPLFGHNWLTQSAGKTETGRRRTCGRARGGHASRPRCRDSSPAKLVCSDELISCADDKSAAWSCCGRLGAPTRGSASKRDGMDLRCKLSSTLL
jgi:hypothetical protein